MTGGDRLALALRLVLGVLFALAGAMKLRDPEFFAYTLRAFEAGLPAAAIAPLAHGVPWTELLCGLALLSGRWARPAALVTAVMMLVFILAIVSLQWRGLDVECPCFGSLSFVCQGPLGACHVARNAVLAAAAVWVVLRGEDAR